MATYTLFYDVVRRVPQGRVTTYGAVAAAAGLPGRARQVGYAMAALPDDHDVPWHRVINSHGRLAVRKEGGAESPEQRRRLTAEGVFFDRHGRVDFAQVAWPGPDWQWLEESGFDLESLIARSAARKRNGAWCRWRF